MVNFHVNTLFAVFNGIRSHKGTGYVDFNLLILKKSVIYIGVVHILGNARGRVDDLLRFILKFFAVKTNFVTRGARGEGVKMYIFCVT